MLSIKYFIPVNIKMHTADNHNIHILGATLLRLSGGNNKGEDKSTRQMVKVTNSSDKLFLSREACVDIGIIFKFSDMDGIETDPKNSINTVTITTLVNVNAPGGKNTTNPYLPCQPNREKLQQYLLHFQYL